MLVNAPKNSLIFLHNHPKNRIFSERDLESFMAADGILLMGVVCNNGTQYFMSKNNQFDKEEALNYYNEIYDKTKMGCIKEFHRTAKNVGLEFRYGGV